MTRQTNAEFDLNQFAPILIRLFFILGPIIVGIVHQFLMFFFNIDSIYVFVNPPGSIRPAVSVEFEWWLVLLLATSVLCAAAYSSRFRNIPTRIAIPAYIYILFLLILVKPI